MSSIKKEGLTAVVTRNGFYRDYYKRTILMVLVMIVVNGILGFSIFYKTTHPPQPQYFAATPDGRIIHIHPLSDPVFTNDHVLQWATKAARQAFNLDYVHWRGQLMQESTYFSTYGWKDFMSQLHATNNLKTLISQKMVASAQVTGSPQLVETAVVDGHYAWKINVPLLITYQNATRSIPQTVMLTMLVIRMPVQDDPNRIAINNFIADVR